MKKIIFSIFILIFISSCGKEDSDVSGSSEEYSIDGEVPGNGHGQIPPGQITAGEWNDLTNWDFWNELIQNQDYSTMPEYWYYNLSDRISINLKNLKSENLIDISLKLIDSNNIIIYESKTDNFGNAELWSALKNDVQIPIENLKIEINGQIFENLIPYSVGINNLVLNTGSQNNEIRIDIAFVVDATGSMSDELEYLKVELVDIIEKVKNQNSNSEINTASVFYRDEGDAYLTRKSEFSEDIEQTINFIDNQSAGGGGDFPEAVHSALNVAVNDLQWSSFARSRVIFLILDAPPHHEFQIISEIHDLVYTASKNGIKIIPVTASGINKETEFLMRYFSIATNGTYVFITNHSGIGNEHLEPTVGEYQVEFLNDLLERLINKYLE